MAEEIDTKKEWLRCRSSPIYAIHSYFQIFNATEKAWLPFHLWPEQVKILRELEQNRLVVVAKSRQIGASWLCICWLVHAALFRPIVHAGVFSRTDNDAQELLQRVVGVYNRLPPWMKAKQIVKSNAHEFEISNGSTLRGLPYTQSEGRSYGMCLIDEADRFDNADELMVNLKPSIDMGGKMVICSISSKDKPTSSFKNIFRAAVKGENEWKPIFLSWKANPQRTQAWYDGVYKDALARSGGDPAAADDEMGQQYPSTWEEAFSPISRDTRLPFRLLEVVFEELPPIATEVDLQIPNLTVYKNPIMGIQYVITCDTAEGNVNSDNSVSHVSIKDTGEEVAVLCAKLSPAMQAGYTHKLAVYYNAAGILPERANHGGTFIQEMENIFAERREYDGLPKTQPKLLAGQDGRPGWISSKSGKTLAYDDYHTLIREAALAGQKILHSRDTQTELSMILQSNLSAPEGQHDDRAVAAMLTARARTASVQGFSMFRI